MTTTKLKCQTKVKMSKLQLEKSSFSKTTIQGKKTGTSKRITRKMTLTK